MAHIRRLLLTLAVACISTLAFGRGNLKELMVPLKYTPQDATSANLPPALRDQAVEVRVEDARKLADPLVIGQGTKKGLITKAEYDKKRAEILKDM